MIPVLVGLKPCCELGMIESKTASFSMPNSRVDGEPGVFILIEKCPHCKTPIWVVLRKRTHDISYDCGGKSLSNIEEIHSGFGSKQHIILKSERWSDLSYIEAHMVGQ